ncbi:MAG: FAD-dependent thymidylate synthase [Theionarchaea archaeon]|nr:FAD-dependent thymidylate synthase [Theionarchaea archaeon]
MKVLLIAHTPEPDRLCAQAALVSKWPEAWSEFKDRWNDATDLQHLHDALEKGHISVIEHAVFTFSLEGISRAASHQLVRHRIASYTQQSQRYVPLDDSSPFIIPDTVKMNDKASVLVTSNVAQQQALYETLLRMGIPPEDARFILPNATRTNLIMTMNARELLHFFALRCCERTQWELREVAWNMLELVKLWAPIIFSRGGPSCVQTGICPEGDLSCGKSDFMKKKAESLGNARDKR